jgi:hypothetical protein
MVMCGLLGGEIGVDVLGNEDGEFTGGIEEDLITLNAGDRVQGDWFPMS